MKKNTDADIIRARVAMSGEGRFRRMVEGLKRDYFFYCHDRDGVFTYISPSIRNILGYSVKEFLKHFTEYLTDNQTVQLTLSEMHMHTEALRSFVMRVAGKAM